MNYSAADSVIIAVAQELLPDDSAIVIAKRTHGVLVITPDIELRDKVSQDVVDAIEYDGEIDTDSVQYLCFKCSGMVDSWCAYVNSDYAVSLVTYTHSPLVKRRLSYIAYDLGRLLEAAYGNNTRFEEWGHEL